jgi:dCMP deaminase
MASQLELDNCYMQTALAHATLSKARRAKVGCCIVTPQFTLLCGYNGTPIGYDNNCEKENTDGTLVTHSHVIHAEANAVAAAARTGVSLVGACAYVTMCPCVSCSVLLKQVGITRVVYRDTYRDNSGILMLNQLGVKVEKL